MWRRDSSSSLTVEIDEANSWSSDSLIPSGTHELTLETTATAVASDSCLEADRDRHRIRFSGSQSVDPAETARRREIGNHAASKETIQDARATSNQAAQRCGQAAGSSLLSAATAA